MSDTKLPKITMTPMTMEGAKSKKIAHRYKKGNAENDRIEEEPMMEDKTGEINILSLYKLIIETNKRFNLTR